MQSTVKALLALMMTMAALSHAAQAGPADAAITCTPSARRLVYDCLISLSDKETKRPIIGATISVNADMPSMPMAHSVPPQAAAATAEVGIYRVQLTLEMHGTWALRLTIGGTHTDTIVRIMRFTPQ